MRGWLRRRAAMRGMSCEQVASSLQSYLDGQVDDLTARRVRDHLEMCRVCGLEAETYTAIKEAIARRGTPVEREVLERLERFGRRLADEGPIDETGSSA